MGNCNQNFDQVGDLDYVEHFQAASSMPHQEPSVSVGPRMDEQTIHNTIIRKEQAPPPIFEEALSKMSFPPEPQVISISEPVPHKVRPKLQELDLRFYHNLGLPDYEYPEIPEEDREDYEGVETHELKDNYGVKYVGEWKNNDVHGNGVLLSNTAKYIGQFKRGLKHYHGRQILKNEVYEGQFEGGRRKGTGIRYTPQFTERGQFDHDFIEGDIYYLDGRVDHKNAGEQKEKTEDHEYTFRQEDEHNQTLNSLYTDKYYEDSELPADWYDERQLQLKNGTEKRDSTSNNARFN